jgi:acyl-CoA reductase-like NAD-dependent aldehyde dehydrogenase
MSDPEPPKFVRGDATGLAIPADSEALRTAGAAFLTEAFRGFGSMSPRNRIARISRFAEAIQARSSFYRSNINMPTRTCIPSFS